MSVASGVVMGIVIDRRVSVGGMVRLRLGFVDGVVGWVPGYVAWRRVEVDGWTLRARTSMTRRSELAALDSRSVRLDGQRTKMLCRGVLWTRDPETQNEAAGRGRYTHTRTPDTTSFSPWTFQRVPLEDQGSALGEQRAQSPAHDDISAARSSH